jgi:ribosomal protein S18 acetylase RimI-like enzyme
MLTTRLYEERDQQVVMNYICDLLEHERQFDLGRVSGNLIAQPYLNYLLEKCDETDGAIFVLETTSLDLEVGEIGGYVCVFTHYNSESMIDAQPVYAYIPDIYIHPSCRGLGAGQLLLAAAEQWAKAKGATLLKLSVLSKNVEARAFYNKRGFSEHEILLQKSLS